MLICSKTTFCRNFGIRTAHGPRPWLTAIAPYLFRMDMDELPLVHIFGIGLVSYNMDEREAAVADCSSLR